MKDIVIKRSYTAVIFAVIGSAIFSCFGIFMISIGKVEGVIIGSLTLLFFGVGGAIYVTSLLRTGRLTLRITNKGIIDNKSKVLIPWNNIKKIGIARISYTKSLGILLKDTKKYSKLLEKNKDLKTVWTFLKICSVGVRFAPRKHTRHAPIILPSSKDMSTIKGMLDYNLRTTGYHLALPGGFNRPLKEIVSLIQKRIKS